MGIEGWDRGGDGGEDGVGVIFFGFRNMSQINDKYVRQREMASAWFSRISRPIFCVVKCTHKHPS